MRIRTIKPAFWANEKMARLSVFSRLLAIGLLNYADDHGFFWANPLMVRGSLFPFEEDSKNVIRSLSELESEGYIQLGKSSDGRAVGCVVNFSKHQRVDKPYPSEIQPLAQFQERSANDTGMFVDDSALYSNRKGRGIGIGKEEEKAPSAPLPFASPDFSEAWADFQKHRTEIRKPLKPTSSKAALRELQAMGEPRAIAALRHTVAKGWQGIREPEHVNGHASSTNRHQLAAATAADHLTADHGGWGTNKDGT